mmetsp:Transcript_11240/g.34460  ORF Transcript_11240/g.34460 Transcript_11240/m.34460 type:complete len:249 (+) Transcript_11240:1405-2151(+)
MQGRRTKKSPKSQQPWLQQPQNALPLPSDWLPYADTAAQAPVPERANLCRSHVEDTPACFSESERVVCSNYTCADCDHPVHPLSASLLDSATLDRTWSPAHAPCPSTSHPIRPCWVPHCQQNSNQEQQNQCLICSPRWRQKMTLVVVAAAAEVVGAVAAEAAAAAEAIAAGEHEHSDQQCDGRPVADRQEETWLHSVLRPIGSERACFESLRRETSILPTHPEEVCVWLIRKVSRGAFSHKTRALRTH